MVFGLKTAPNRIPSARYVVSSALAYQGIAHVRYLDDFLLTASSAHRVGLYVHHLRSGARARQRRRPRGTGKIQAETPLTRLEFLGIPEAPLVVGAAPAVATRKIDLRINSSARRAPIHSPHYVRYWATHLAQWNGKERWRAPTSTPFVFGSDASTAGFAFGLESCPEEAMSRLPLNRQPGHISCGLWSAEDGNAARQSTVPWPRRWPMARCWPTHMLSLSSTTTRNSDLSVISRMRSREPRVAALLRALCVSFSAVHRAGDENTLMDWASRPDLHRFRGSPSAFQDATPAVAGGGGVGRRLCFHLSRPRSHSLTLTVAV
jgi:hypothetical protein